MLAATRTLQAHNAKRTDSVTAISVEIALLPQRRLQLTYALTGNLAQIRIPEPQAACRADGLWQHTCFEAFIQPEAGEAYREFNFSPSGCWQAYAFTGYRSGGLLEIATDPHIAMQSRAATLHLQATLQLDDLPSATCCKLGLTAVIEAADGTLGYWALQHAPGKPDFHHPDTFALELTL
jgi:hypothetical protein